MYVIPYMLVSRKKWMSRHIPDLEEKHVHKRQEASLKMSGEFTVPRLILGGVCTGPNVRRRAEKCIPGLI